MKIIDIITGQWAIVGEMWSEILALYSTHMRGDKIDIRGLEARIGLPFQQERSTGYDVQNGKAIISVTDVLTPDLNFFSMLFGGTSTKQIVKNAQAAQQDPSVNELFFYFNTPGGTVAGMFEAFHELNALKGQKPMTGVIENMCASAGYLLAAPMDKLYITSQTVQVGSIGVLYSHKDISKALEMSGIKVTDITSGELKRLGSPFKALTDEDISLIRDDIKSVANMFFSAVSDSRKIPVNNIAALKGGILRGQQAIQAGLVDGVSTLERLISNTAGGVSATGFRLSTGSKDNSIEEDVMNLAELKEKHPDVYKAVYQEGFTAGKEKGMDDMECPEHCKEQSKKEGASAETARVKAVKEQLIPGHEALIETLMFDGVTTGEQAAVKVLAAEKTLRTDMKGKIAADAAAVPAVPAAEAGLSAPAEASDDRPVETIAKEKWEADKDLRAEFGGDYDRYLSYEKASSEKKFKVLKK